MLPLILNFIRKRKSVQDDLFNLKRKMEAGANSAITQYFFNADAYFYYRDACEREGITLPLRRGLCPLLNLASLRVFQIFAARKFHVGCVNVLKPMVMIVSRFKQFGIEVVHDLCQRLIAGGAPGLHFYTLNRAEATLAVLQSLRLLVHAVASEKQAVGAD